MQTTFEINLNLGNRLNKNNQYGYSLMHHGIPIADLC